jgi:hypothetical protein
LPFSNFDGINLIIRRCNLRRNDESDSRQGAVPCLFRAYPVDTHTH